MEASQQAIILGSEERLGDILRPCEHRWVSPGVSAKRLERSPGVGLRVSRSHQEKIRKFRGGFIHRFFC